MALSEPRLRDRTLARMQRSVTVILLVGTLLAGCSPVPTRTTENPVFTQAYLARFEHLQLLTDWAVEGRLAISDGKDGGSGTLSWAHTELETRMSFHGAMGKGAWRLQADATGARLELGNGSVHSASTIAELVREQVGWKVPVEALSWWVKGLAQPGDWDTRVLDAEGRVTALRQSGWDVDFGNYAEPEVHWLPSKLTARQGKYLVKVAVRKWKLGVEGSGIE